jgi:hypothetical protein
MHEKQAKDDSQNKIFHPRIAASIPDFHDGVSAMTEEWLVKCCHFYTVINASAIVGMSTPVK